MTLPNGLTLTRIVLVPLLVAALLAASPAASLAAAGVFVAAAATDWLDGYLARSRGSVTAFGMVMDPIADKLLIGAALVSLVALGRLAAWVAVVILARELAVSALRLAASQQGALIPASQFGKAKTASQVAAVTAVIVAPVPDALWVLALVYVSVVVTVASGLDYFLSYRRRVDAARAVGAGASPAP